MKAANVFFSESVSVGNGEVSWFIECLTINDDGTWGPFCSQAIGGTSTKWAARRRLKKWKRQMLREALDATPIYEREEK